MKMFIIKGKEEKTARTKCKFRGEELLGPQASLRVTPCRKLQIILGEKLFGPQARLRITPIA